MFIYKAPSASSTNKAVLIDNESGVNLGKICNIPDATEDINALFETTLRGKMQSCVVKEAQKDTDKAVEEFVNAASKYVFDSNNTDIDISKSPIIQEFIEKYGLRVKENEKEGNNDMNECTGSVSFELSFKNPFVNSSKNESAKKIIDFIKKSIDKVIFKGRTTRVVWKDGSVTEVTAQKGDEFNKEQGVTLCIFKMLMGNTYHYYDLIKYLVDKADKEEADRRKKKEEKLAKKAEAKRKKQMEEALANDEAAAFEEVNKTEESNNDSEEKLTKDPESFSETTTE